MAAYALTIFLSAFLLFLVQPLLSRAILPWFGGSPATWTTCLLFFQAALLLGYVYAHLVVTRLHPRVQAGVHLGIVALALIGLPIVPDAAWAPGPQDDPAWRVLGLLTVTVGLPYLALSASAPLLQAWLAREAQARPYRLYALSNLGSFLALLAYPLAIEPSLGVKAQGWAWSGGFALYSLLILWIAWKSARADAVANPADGDGFLRRPGYSAEAPPPWSTQVLWLVLSATPSALLLGVSNRLGEDVAVIPFLWVLPLGAYLLTFVVTFERDAWYGRAWGLPLGAAGVVMLLLAFEPGEPGRALALNLGGLFLLCFTCHGELARLKPSPAQLTRFYLVLSLGGALGGALVALAAPRLFVTVAELPLAIVAAVGAVGWAVWQDPTLLASWREQRPRRARLVPILLVAGLLGLGELLRRGEANRRADVTVVALSRNFYGTLRVEDKQVELANGRTFTFRRLLHGDVGHGAELIIPGAPPQARTYYTRDSGVGRVLQALGQDPAHVGVVGLGAGCLAAYARPGDRYTFWEIDPDVIRHAADRFSFLPYARRNETQIALELGDARRSLELATEPLGCDVLVLDAFTAGVVPVHLLTAETFDLYRRHTQPQGVMVIHVTNTHSAFDLAPQVLAQAERLGLVGSVVLAAGDPPNLKARWVVLTTPRRLQTLGLEPTLGPYPEVWTDDRIDLLGALKE